MKWHVIFVRKTGDINLFELYLFAVLFLVIVGQYIDNYGLALPYLTKPIMLWVLTKCLSLRGPSQSPMSFWGPPTTRRVFEKLPNILKKISIKLVCSESADDIKNIGKCVLVNLAVAVEGEPFTFSYCITIKSNKHSVVCFVVGLL